MANAEQNAAAGVPYDYAVHPVTRSQIEALGEHSPEVALKADLGPGITTFLHPTRGAMVRIPGCGDGMTWKAAMKAFGPK